jgi:hypothetical protein
MPFRLGVGSHSIPDIDEGSMKTRTGFLYGLPGRRFREACFEIKLLICNTGEQDEMDLSNGDKMIALFSESRNSSRQPKCSKSDFHRSSYIKTKAVGG